jgi:hypothetical protein
MSAEVHLWRAVVTQAIADATMPIRPVKPRRVPSVLDDPDQAAKAAKTKRVIENYMRSYARERTQARDWLLNDSRDFRDVCERADLNPDAMCESAQSLERRGWPEPRAARVHRQPGAHKYPTAE